jgi:hypothetical protein
MAICNRKADLQCCTVCEYHPALARPLPTRLQYGQRTNSPIHKLYEYACPPTLFGSSSTEQGLEVISET